MTHTPGPWRVDLNPYDKQYRVYQEAEGGCPIINSLFKSQGPEAEANARLIAAAPALYEACRLALKMAKGLMYEEAEEVDDAYVANKLEEALRLAEGGKP